MKKFVSMFLVILSLISCMSVTAFAAYTPKDKAGSPVLPLADAPAMTTYVEKVGGVTFSNVVKHEQVTGYDYDGNAIPMYKVTLGVSQPSATCMKSTSNKSDFIFWRDGFYAPNIGHIEGSLRTGGVMEYAQFNYHNLEFYGITGYADEKNAKNEWIGGLVWEFDVAEVKAEGSNFKAAYFITAIVDGQTYNYLITVTNRPEFPNRPGVKSFSDVPEDFWAYKEIMNMVKKDVIAGTTTPDANGVGTFSPNSPMTRAQFVAVVIRYLYLAELGNMPTEDGAPWYSNHLQLAYKHGILKPSELSGQAEMEKPMTRQEMAMVLSRALILTNQVRFMIISNDTIPDYNNIDPYYQIYVKLAYSEGLISGIDTAGTFNAEGTLNRAQAATVLNRLIVPNTRNWVEVLPEYISEEELSLLVK